MRRLGVVPLLVFVVAVAAASSAATRPGWVEYEDRGFGWRFEHPARMRPAQFEGFTRISWYGVAFSNVLARAPSSWPLEAPKLPPDGVLVRFWYQEGGPSYHEALRDDRLPASPRQLRRLSFGPRPRPRVAMFQFGGAPLGVAVWTGTRARRNDVAAVGEIIRRFRPTPLRTGGVTRPCGFFVLDRVRGYARGTARRYDTGDLPENDCVWRRPFYLVRTGTALYAIGWPPDSRGYKNCGVTFDETRFEFFCANGARWNRFGRVISVPRGWRGTEEPLARYSVVRGYDDHVLVSPNSYRYS
jgi:hypothetical protein